MRSTSRPCCSRPPAPTTATTPPIRAGSTPTGAGAEGCGRCWPRPGHAGLGWWSTWCPTTSASRCPPRTRPGGTCCSTAAASAYAGWFDIDWSRNRIVVPILGDDAVLTVTDGELRYFEHRFPLAPGSWTDGDPDAVHARQHYELVHHSPGQQRAQLPPVLRRDHPCRRAGRGPGGASRRPTPWCRDGCSRRRDRAADRPPGRSGRPGRVPGPAARAGSRRLDHGGEDPGGRRGAAETGRSPAPPATTPCARSTGSSSTPTARRS